MVDIFNPRGVGVSVCWGVGGLACGLLGQLIEGVF